jgi:hypothetical protein
MISAETQSDARRLVDKAMAEAEAGRLDPRIQQALKRTIVIRTPLQRQRPPQV